MGVLARREETEALQRAVLSVLDQTYSDFELLICDDGSAAEARLLLEQLADRDERVRIIRGSKRLDLAPKLNFCLTAARGAYVARMDDDDYSYPERLDKQLRFLKEHADISFAGCSVALVRNGQNIGERHLPLRPQVEDFYFVQPYIHPALLFRREALEAVGGYSEETDCILCEDYDLLLRMYEKNMKGANLEEVLLDYTVSDGSTRKMRHRLNEVKTRYRRFNELGKLPEAWPYVLKPVVVGLLPKSIAQRLKAEKLLPAEGDGYRSR